MFKLTLMIKKINTPRIIYIACYFNFNVKIIFINAFKMLSWAQTHVGQQKTPCVFKFYFQHFDMDL